MSVDLHLYSAPESVSLFRAALMESNFFALPYPRLDEARNVGNIYMHSMNCSDVPCLRKLDATNLVQSHSPFSVNLEKIFSGQKYYIPFGPVIDGEVLTGDPIDIATSSKSTKPLLVGTNKNEGLIFVNPSYPTLHYVSTLASLFGLHFQRILEKYPAKSDTENAQSLAKVFTDGILSCGARRVATVSKHPVFAYLFNHPPSFKLWGPPVCEQDGNVCHGAELPFVFHTASKFNAKFTPEEEIMSNAMMDYWTNFAKHLNPNGDPSHRAATVHWPPFTPSAKNYLTFDTSTVSLQSDPNGEICEFWDGLGYDARHPWNKHENR